MTDNVAPYTTAFPGARILIADDEPGIRRTLIEILRRVGYHPSEAASGTEALQKIQTESFDLVLLDLNMPGSQARPCLRRGVHTPPVQSLSSSQPTPRWTRPSRHYGIGPSTICSSLVRCTRFYKWWKTGWPLDSNASPR